MAEKEEKPAIEQVAEEPKVGETVEKLKVKKPKKKKFQEPEDGIIKLDLTEKQVGTEEPVKVDLSKPVEEIKVPEEEVETPVLQEITDETEVEKVAEVVRKEITESVETGRELPEMSKN